MGSLTTPGIKALKEAGRYSDGGNLYLQVTKTGGKSWLFIYRWQGKQKEMGLGAFPDVGLSDARQAADDARRLLKNKSNPQDPLSMRRAAQAEQEAVQTFGTFAEATIDDLKEQWRNAKHRAQWKSTLSTYAKPIWDKPIDEIGVDDILEVLKPIWIKKAVTATRVRGRIEKILDAATARGLRTGENPARWRGHLNNLLSKPQKLQRGHHAAMPYEEVSAFVSELRARDGTSARAIEFLILCASRSGEVIGATWEEIDLDKKVWVIPAPRMKAGKEHRVPLTDRAVAILTEMKPFSERKNAKGETVTTGIVFRGSTGGAMSAMTLTMQLRRMEKGHYTIHGFRSAFRDWVGDETSFSETLAEHALAHKIGDDTEIAYRRKDALERRRQLMEAWATYIEPKAPDSNVIPIRQV